MHVSLVFRSPIHKRVKTSLTMISTFVLDPRTLALQDHGHPHILMLQIANAFFKL